MRLNKRTFTTMALGLSISLSLVTAQVAEAGGPTPQLSPAEEGAFALAETLLSITAALVTKGGCANVVGGPFSIQAGVNGDGTATFPTNQVNGVMLKVTRGLSVISFGTKYTVDQFPQGERQYLNLDSIKDYAGDLNYSDGGAILTSRSEFRMFEFGFDFPWGEHNIKDFWTADEYGAHIEDTGLEVVTKGGYPLTKWRQASNHWRLNSTGVGEFLAKKSLITPSNVSDCHIEMIGTVNQMLGQFTMHGDIMVLNLDF